MIRLKSGQEQRIRELFSKCEDTLVWSYLQGYMGEGDTDNLENPRLGRIISNDFCYLAGDVDVLEAKEFLRNFPSDINRKELILMPCGEQWEDFIENNIEYIKGERYAIKKEGDIFNREKLKQYVSKLPKEYEMRLIDCNLYDKVMAQNWSEDFCSNFKNAEDFVNRGIGVVVLNQEEIIAGASSFSIYDKGIEVEIVTKENYKKQGLATICGAKLILECLNRGKYPSWDAANRISVRVAEKLGYHFDKSYKVYYYK